MQTESFKLLRFDFEDFKAGGGAADQSDSRFGHTEMFGDHALHGCIRLALHRLLPHVCLVRTVGLLLEPDLAPAPGLHYNANLHLPSLKAG